ncbi:epsin-3 isoform X9 [Alligator sinensis]|uniref:Epsin-3 isoform X9 n=1 Tax=Alligator sinensis TaxID=38654 RepID=A0A3Q0G5M7_ALLSI|nr:epsin-3 isoform X9 [Alligator sinensis]
MTTSALRRQVKNIVHNYSEAEIKVREATSNDPWGPPSSLMSEIADLTFNTVAFAEVMGMIWRRLNDSGKNWRHVYKALTLLDYLIKTGSEKVAHQCRENLFTIQTLKDFQYIDRDGKDQGINVREKVKQVMALLKDEERLKQERAHALKTKERMSVEGMGISSSSSHQLSYGRRTSQYGEDYGRSRGSPSSFNSSSSSPQFTSDLEQARPQTTGEEELQLQLALAMSREEAEKKPVPPASTTEEEMQLQIALTLSKVEHEKEVRAWQGENSLLQKTLEETQPGVEEEEEEDKLKTSQSSILELADIFGPAPATSTRASADPWNIPGGDNSQSATAWDNGGTFSPPPALSLSSSWDPNNLDPFGDPVLMTKQDGAKSFDLTSLADSLADSRKDCKTPESFLDPAASSLVNLDSLVTAPQTSKTRNPFLSGLSAPSPTNPFSVGDQAKPTLNQMRTSSPVPGVAMGMTMNAMTYSASLPLPLSSIPSAMTLPASMSAFPQAGAGPFPELPSNLPQPLLPLTGSTSLPTSQGGRNPFL